MKRKINKTLYNLQFTNFKVVWVDKNFKYIKPSSVLRDKKDNFFEVVKIDNSLFFKENNKNIFYPLEDYNCVIDDIIEGNSLLYSIYRLIDFELI